MQENVFTELSWRTGEQRYGQIWNLSSQIFLIGKYITLIPRNSQTSHSVFIVYTVLFFNVSVFFNILRSVLIIWRVPYSVLIGLIYIYSIRAMNQGRINFFWAPGHLVRMGPLWPLFYKVCTVI